MPSVAALLATRRGAGSVGLAEEKALQPAAARSARAGPRSVAERMAPPWKERDHPL